MRLFICARTRGVTPVSDKKTRLLEAERALHGLEIQVEQYRLHIDGLAAHPQEAERARAVLKKLNTQLASQRTYCGLLEKAAPDDSVLPRIRVIS